MLILCYLIVAASFFVHVDPKSGEFTDSTLPIDESPILLSLRKSFNNQHAYFVVQFLTIVSFQSSHVQAVY